MCGGGRYDCRNRRLRSHQVAMVAHPLVRLILWLDSGRQPFRHNWSPEGRRAEARRSPLAAREFKYLLQTQTHDHSSCRYHSLFGARSLLVFLRSLFLLRHAYLGSLVKRSFRAQKNPRSDETLRQAERRNRRVAERVKTQLKTTPPPKFASREFGGDRCCGNSYLCRVKII